MKLYLLSYPKDAHKAFLAALELELPIQHYLGHFTISVPNESELTAFRDIVEELYEL